VEEKIGDRRRFVGFLLRAQGIKLPFFSLRVQPQDSGEYICFAKNPVGNVESSAHLHINSPPLFTKLPQNLRLIPGKTAIFECEAFGQPIPRIFWSKEGDQVFLFLNLSFGTMP